MNLRSNRTEVSDASGYYRREEIIQSSMKTLQSKPHKSEMKRGMWIVKLDKMASNDHL